MQRQNDGGAIRLTNKTALALRRCAKQERTMAFCAAAILTVIMAVLAVVLGLRWLIAVPLMTAAAVLLDAAIFVRSRSRYLSLTAQAICAEASARQLRAQRKEQDRRERAMQDFSGVKEDIRRAEKEAQREAKAAKALEEDAPQRAEKPQEEEKASPAAEPEDGEEAPPQETVRRRRRQAALTVLRSEDAK